MRETTVLRRSFVRRDGGEGSLGPRMGRVTCTLQPDGSLELASDAPEFAGRQEVLGLIAQEVLACPGRAVLLADAGAAEEAGPLRRTPPNGGVYFQVGDGLAVGGAVRRAAEELRDCLLELAATRLGAARRELEQVCTISPDGAAEVRFRTRGAHPRSITLAELAVAAQGEWRRLPSGSARFLRRP